jgi:polyisoprenoid-binding protein YceI
VRRGGVLARLGHDHVVASHAISGSVSPQANRADFTFRLDEMKIDEADLRRIAGLEKQPSADAIEGTRHNMLTKVLDAERYPLVQVHAERGAPGQPLQVSITLHGVTRTLAIPAELREENGVITVQGHGQPETNRFRPDAVLRHGRRAGGAGRDGTALRSPHR